MTHRTRALSLVLGVLLVLSLPAGTIGTVGAQEAGNDAPTPVLDAPDTVEEGQLYHLDGSNSTGDIQEYHWDYNPDAPTEYQRSTNYSTIYAEERTDRDQFTVRLGVEDSEGNVEWTSERIDVTAAEDPEASIDSSDNFTVQREQWETKGAAWFNSTSTDNQGIRSCEWTFEYGPTVERTSGDGLGWGSGSTECRKNFSYAVTGTYNVTLTVTDWAGNTDTTTRQVEVVPKHEVTDDPQPNAELSGPDAVEWGATYWLNASNSTSEDDVRYYISEHNPDVWKDDERNLGHDTYYGEYYEGQFDTIDVAVGMITVNDQTDWAWKTIDVLPVEKPNATVEGPDTVATGDWGTFDASNSTDNDRVRSYDWTITNESGETVDTGSGVENSYQFTEPGTYEVTVRVGDWVNHSRDGPYHYGVATKTVTVTEDGEPVNESPTVTASADPRTVTAGNETALTADAADADGTVESVEWELGDGTTATGESVTHSYGGAGTYTATVTVTDDDGSTASDSVEITVEEVASDGGSDSSDGDTGDSEPDDGDSTGDDTDDSTDSSDDTDDNSDSPDDADQSEDGNEANSDDSSAPSSGGTSSAPSADADDGDVSVTVEQVNESADRVEVSDAPDDENVAIDLNATASDDSVGYRRLDVRSTGNESFSLTVAASGNAPENLANDDVEGFDELSFLTVEGTETDNLSDATVEFRVSKDRLEEADAHAEDVALRRYADGGSQAVDTEQINETDDAYVYRAEAGAVTAYAVGVERPVLNVTDLSIADGEQTGGDTVEVTATVVNSGQDAGTKNVSLIIDGEVYDAKSVEVAARDSATATFSLSVEDAEEHTLSAGDASTTLTVASQETATETSETATAATTATTTDEDATPGTAFGGVSGFGALAVLLAVAAAGAALLVYRQ